jgi:hypothetical protein
MPAIFEVLYREYCRARLAEMRNQLLVKREFPEANGDAGDSTGAADPASNVGDGSTASSATATAQQKPGERTAEIADSN